MTFSLTREDYFSQNQILGFDYFTEIQEDLLGFKKGTEGLKNCVLDLICEKKNIFIFVSHEHQDHFDKEFLNCVPLSNSLLTEIMPPCKSIIFFT